MNPQWAGRFGGWVAVLLLAFVVLPAAAVAQVRTDTIPEPLPEDTIPVLPLPADTVAPDSVIVVPIPPNEIADDTIHTARLEEDLDSIFPAPALPALPDPAPTGWAAARWEWEREDLLSYHGLTLIELLERLPGITAVRAGGFNRPAGLTAVGLGGGRVRVFVDGFELEPLSAATPALREIPLTDLASVRVQRSLTGIRIELSTFRLPDVRPYSRVEVGTGPYDTQMLRALFSRTFGARSTVTGAFGLVDTNGFLRDESFTRTAGVLQWSYALDPDAALQLEYRHVGTERGGTVFTETGARQNLILRGRFRPVEGLVVGGVLGRSVENFEDAVGPLAGQGFASNQAAVHAVYELPVGWVGGEARVRSGDGYPRPGLDVSVRGGVAPLPWLQVLGEARYTGTGVLGGTELSATARGGEWHGLSAFATVASGTRGLGVRRDTVVSMLPLGPDTLLHFREISSSGGGVRVGGEWTGRGASVGGALLTVDPGQIVPFGSGFDRGAPAVDAGAAAGWEGYFSVPVFWDAIRLDGWYTRWSDTGGRPYLPEEQGRLELALHGEFYDGELAPTLRLAAERRGRTLVPTASVPAEFSATTEPFTLFNLDLEIRIRDIRAFFIYENLMNERETADLVENPLPGTRFLYGVRWQFRN